MLLSNYKSVNSLSPNHFYFLTLKIVIVFFSSMALRLVAGLHPGEKARGSSSSRKVRKPGRCNTKSKLRIDKDSLKS